MRDGRRSGFACCRGRGGEAEVDLFFESVHFGDLDFDTVAQPNDAASAAAHQVIARGFENKEIIDEGRQMDKAAHGEAGHIDKERS